MEIFDWILSGTGLGMMVVKSYMIWFIKPEDLLNDKYLKAQIENYMKEYSDLKNFDEVKKFVTLIHYDQFTPFTYTRTDNSHLLLKLENLEVYYGVIQAIKGISFEVNEGEVIALIGANGAGKTTILHTITGLVSAKSGSMLFDGHDLTKTPAHKIVSMGIAHVPEGRRIFQGLTLLENLKLDLI